MVLKEKTTARKRTDLTHIKVVVDKMLSCKSCGARLPYYKAKVCGLCKAKQ